MSILNCLRVSPRMRCGRNSKGFGFLIPVLVLPVIIILHQIVLVLMPLLHVQIIVSLRGITLPGEE